ncbi:invasion associated locus B family protein [Devosia sp. A369]
MLIGGPALGAGLPGGASSLQETYQDWRVLCARPDSASLICTFSQMQANQNGQRVLALELMPAANGTDIAGNLVLPFGLLLDAGVILQVDEGAAGAARRFSTCLPDGCIAPLAFDAETLSSLRGGTTLNVHLQAVDGGAMVLPVSLQGFTQALERTRELLAP